MKRRNLTQLACLALVITGCATQQPVSEATAPTTDQRGSVSAEGTVVATRHFQLRSAPSVSAKTVAQYRKGDLLDASIKPYDEIWHFIKIDSGPDGYIFGMPLLPAN